MNPDNLTGDQMALLQALEKLHGEEFSSLDRDTIKPVTDLFLERLATAEEPSGEQSSGWTGRVSSVVERRDLPHSTLSGVSSEAIETAVEITADDREVVEGLLDQIMEIGAVVVQLDPKPQLNELLKVTLKFTGAHLTVETEGRVVHQSASGTAIEVSNITQEDRLALQAISKDLDAPETVSMPLEPDESFPGHISVADSVLVPGAIPAFEEDPDPMRSFAPLGSQRGTGRSAQRRMVNTTSRRQVELPDPDLHVLTSSKRVERRAGGTTREVYGPPPPWLEARGDADRIEMLDGERILDILLQLSEDGFTGVMDFRGDDQEEVEQLLFDGGYVVERSTRPRTTGEELGPMLLAADRITKRQLAMAAAHADEIGVTVARSLMDLDILNPQELRQAIAGRLAFVLEEFCGHRTGEVHIFDSQALPAGFLPQPPLRVHAAVERVIFHRLYRKLSQLPSDQRDQQMQDYLDAYPEIIEHERDRLQRAVSVAEQERMLESVVTGRKRMREVMTESELSAAETFGVIMSLHRMGLVRFDRSLHDTVVRERLRENITVKYLSVHKASYFEVLNVHWSSYSEVVERAYRTLVEQFDAAKMPSDLEEDVMQKVEEINERVEAAYAALAKRETRHAYRTRIMPDYKLEHAIPLFLKQSELARRRQKWEDAEDALLRVLDIVPDHEEARRSLEKVEQISLGKLAPDPTDTNH